MKGQRILRLALVLMTVGSMAGMTPLGAAANTFRCTNPYSQATWDIEVDDKRGTADSFPATITQSQISWHDTLHGGYYYLDRTSGDLTVVFASSTGGFALHDKCHPG
jgi:hypothetical protein